MLVLPVTMVRTSLGALLIYILMMICLLESCGKKDAFFDNATTFSSFPKEEKIFFKNIHEFKKGVPNILRKFDNKIVLFTSANKSNNKFLHIYSLNRDTIFRSILDYGRGPGEAMSVINLGINKDVIWVYDVTANKIMTLDNIGDMHNVEQHLFKEYAVKDHYYMIHLKDSLNFFGAGDWNSKFKISKVDIPSREIIDNYGAFDTTGSDSYSFSKKSSYQAFMYTNPIDRKIVLSYQFVDAIEIFDEDKIEESIKVRGPFGYDVDFSPTKKGMTFTEKTRQTFVNGAVTQKYIYLAYSGKLAMQRNSSYSNSVFVYDWMGNPIKEMVFDNNINCLTVSEDDKTMYAYDIDTGYLIEASIN